METSITELLGRWREGDSGALDVLAPRILLDLRNIARGYLAREPSNISLQPTELVDEAFLHLEGWRRVEWRDRQHFFRSAAKLMRRLLVDHARHRRAMKRGGEVQHVPFDEIFHGQTIEPGKSLELAEAMEKLGELNARQLEAFELQFFFGLSIQEIGEVMGVAPRTVVRYLEKARIHLHLFLSREASE